MLDLRVILGFLRCTPLRHWPGIIYYFLGRLLYRLCGVRLFNQRILRPGNFALVAEIDGMSGLFFLYEILVQDLYAFPSLDKDASVKVLFDAGANCGFFAITRCLKNPGWRAYCFEPHPVTFAKLRENISVNGMTGRIIPINAALGAVSGQCELVISEQSSMGVISGSCGRLMTHDHRPMPTSKITVPVITMDEFAGREKVYPDLLKIDVEGFEVEVMKGAAVCLNTTRYVIMEWHSDSLLAETTAILYGAGFKTDYKPPHMKAPIVFAQKS